SSRQLSRLISPIRSEELWRSSLPLSLKPSLKQSGLEYRELRITFGDRGDGRGVTSRGGANLTRERTVVRSLIRIGRKKSRRWFNGSFEIVCHSKPLPGG